MVACICTQFHENILNSSRADMIFIGIISKGHNSVKIKVELRFFFSAHRLIMIYICTKFQENILNGIKFIERTRFSEEKFQRGITP